ncbi:MAG TPA: DEAD/DEAH box helicase [Chloroflexota bacterium]|nr:DEAD/DEAH box helicase [Chloroflexota bacterium]
MTQPAAASFDAFDLSAPVTRALAELGFDVPTPIQREAVPPLLAGRDVVAQAQTGTGKTAAFGIPIVERAEPRLAQPQVLILAPTRELAVQVAGAIFELGKHRGLRVLPVYGGQPYDRQLRGLRNGAHVVVGTPGRILDHLRRGSLDLAKVGLAVLDEADEMLNMGFLEDMEAILAALREARGEAEAAQIALFSATIPPRIRDLAQKFMRDAVRIDVTTGQVTVPQVEQVAYEIGGLTKHDALARVLDAEDPDSAIVFCATRRNVDEVSDRLAARGHRVASIHGDVAQRERERVMRAFRDGQTDVLVATDVAARGLDVESVTHVINFDIPWDAESYVHRIGRTARAGRAGDAITLVTPREHRALRMIEHVLQTPIARKRLPSTSDVAARRRAAAKDTLMHAIAEGDLDAYRGLAAELGNTHDPLEVAAAALRLWDRARSEVGPRGPLSLVAG